MRKRIAKVAFYVVGGIVLDLVVLVIALSLPPSGEEEEDDD